jgi:hypothetical protein
MEYDNNDVNILPGNSFHDYHLMMMNTSGSYQRDYILHHLILLHKPYSFNVAYHNGHVSIISMTLASLARAENY